MNKGGQKKNVEEKPEPKSQEEVTRLVIGKKRKMRKLQEGQIDFAFKLLVSFVYSCFVSVYFSIKVLES